MEYRKNLPLENEPPVFLNIGSTFNKMWVVEKEHVDANQDFKWVQTWTTAN